MSTDNVAACWAAFGMGLILLMSAVMCFDSPRTAWPLIAAGLGLWALVIVRIVPEIFR